MHAPDRLLRRALDVDNDATLIEDFINNAYGKFGLYENARRQLTTQDVSALLPRCKTMQHFECIFALHLCFLETKSF